MFQFWLWCKVYLIFLNKQNYILQLLSRLRVKYGFSALWLSIAEVVIDQPEGEVMDNRGGREKKDENGTIGYIIKMRESFPFLFL